MKSMQSTYKKLDAQQKTNYFQLSGRKNWPRIKVYLKCHMPV